MVYWQRSGTFCDAAEQFYRAGRGFVLRELAACSPLYSAASAALETASQLAALRGV